MADDTGDGIFLIPEGNFKKFEQEIERLSKKSLKLTGEPITPIVFGYEMKDMGGYELKLYQVLLGGPAPKLNGWSFLATLDHANKEVGTLVRPVPGKTLPSKYRTSGCTCEHCSVNRFRRCTYVVQNDETGETKQVGSACLKDFLGHSSPEKIAKLAELLGYAAEAARGWSNSQGEDRRYLNLEQYLAFTAREVRIRGYFITKAKARELSIESTSVSALSNLLNKIPSAPNDDDYQLAQRAIVWAQELSEQGRELNDYDHNINVIASSGSIEFYHTGFAASIISSYNRTVEEVRVAQQTTSKHLGRVGERLDIQVVIRSIKALQNDFGTSFLHTMQDSAGNHIKGFFNKRLGDEGQSIQLRATVKAHDVFKGIQQTVVNRPVVK